MNYKHTFSRVRFGEHASTTQRVTNVKIDHKHKLIVRDHGKLNV